MVLLENTLRHDAEKGSPSRLRTGRAQAREPAVGMHTRRRIGTATPRASASGHGDSSEVLDFIDGDEYRR